MELKMAAKELMREYYDVLEGVGVKDDYIVALVTNYEYGKQLPFKYKEYDIIKINVGTLKILSYK